MKSIALILALCVSGAVASVTSDQVLKLLRYKEECMGETGSTDEMIGKAIQEGTNFQKEAKLGCFIACILKKLGIMNEDGSIDVPAAEEQVTLNIPKDEVHNMIIKCTNTGGADVCEKAAYFADCLVDEYLESKGRN